MDVAPSGFAYPSTICDYVFCNGASGAMHDNASLICAPSTGSAVCGRHGLHQPPKFVTLSLDPTDAVYTPMFEAGLLQTPSPFYYITVNNTVYVLSTSTTEPNIFLGGVVPTADGADLHLHYIVELLSQGRDLRDVHIGPPSTTVDGVLLILSIGTTLFLAPLSSDFHTTKSELTMGGGLQSLDWTSPESGGNAALEHKCPSAWRLIPDKGSNSILVVCKNRLLQLKLGCDGPNFTRCSFRNETHNATGKFRAPVAILHDANNTAVCYITQDPQGLLSKSMSAFPSTLDRLTYAPLLDEDTKKMLSARGPICIPPDGQGCTAFFINKDDGELYKLMIVDGAVKCKKLHLGKKCDSCYINTCQRDPETVALTDNSTGFITIFDPVTGNVLSTSIPGASKLSLFGLRAENPHTAESGTTNQQSNSDSYSSMLELKVGLPTGILTIVTVVGAIITVITLIFLKKRTIKRTPMSPVPPVPPIPCTETHGGLGSPIIKVLK